ncbi:MAG: leucine-rich repeat domain-containing protein [Tannerella sp.]|nr:leucine-rich repeat domain-containing protein [Tannerella sp.]
MKKLFLSLWMIASLNAMNVQGAGNEPKIKVTSVNIVNDQGETIKYKGQQISRVLATFKVSTEIQVLSPTRLKCSLYMMKQDFNRSGTKGYMQALYEPPGSFHIPPLTDLMHLEKIYEFPVVAVTANDKSLEWDWDGYTQEIGGKRYPVRDVIAVVLEDADTGELFLRDNPDWGKKAIDFSYVSRYGPHYNRSFVHGIAKANQNSISINVFFASELPAKNATVILETNGCYYGALSAEVVNKGGKAVAEDMHRRNNESAAVIGYKELGPIEGGGKINDFTWEVTDMDGKLFIPRDEALSYTLRVVLEGENGTLNNGLNEGEICGSDLPLIPMPKAYQNREPNEGAPYHVEVPGTLAALLGNKINTITELSLSGSINGYDIETIGNMKQLEVLDMARVDIVEGGDPYSQYYSVSDQFDGAWGIFGGFPLSSVTLPNNADYVNPSVFGGCDNLKTITLGINTQFFDLFSLSALEEFIVPGKSNYFSSVDGVLFNKGSSPIWGLLFMYNEGQTTLICYPGGKSGESYTIPEGTAIIGWSAFWDNPGLKHLVIPKSVTMVLNPFNSSLIDIYCHNPVPPKAYYFDETLTSTCILYVPKGSKAAYAAAEGWKDFRNIVEMSPVAVEEISQSDISIRAIPGGIAVESDESVSVAVYSVLGQAVYESNVQGNRQIGLSRGVYVVKAGRTVKKVVVN